jgi:TPR repeat protein
MGDFADMKARAMSGDLDACYQIGTKFKNGTGVTKNDTEAYTWYLKAGNGGHIISQFLVGQALETGSGCPKNEAEACKWYLVWASAAVFQS